MNLTTIFDEVNAGVSKGEDFLNKALSFFEGELGTGSPIAAKLAAVHTTLQQLVSSLNTSISGAETALVMTETVYNQLIGTAKNLYDLALSGLPANATLAQKIEAGALKVAEVGLPLVLSVLPAGGTVTLVLEDAEKIVQLFAL